MAFYDVICTNCKYKEIDFEQSICSNFPAKCPSCKKKKLIKDYSSPDAVPDFHIKEIKTVIQQSEANVKRLGKEQIEMKRDKLFDNEFERKKKNAPRPWWRPEGKEGEKPLDVTKIKNVGDFIEHGVKD